MASCQLYSHAGSHSEHLVIREVCVHTIMQLLRMVERVFGKKYTEESVRCSVFKQFAGGEDEQSVLRTMHRLATKDVGSILFYSAEQDIDRWVWHEACMLWG